MDKIGLIGEFSDGWVALFWAKIIETKNFGSLEENSHERCDGVEQKDKGIDYQ